MSPTRQSNVNNSPETNLLLDSLNSDLPSGMLTLQNNLARLFLNEISKLRVSFDEKLSSFNNKFESLNNDLQGLRGNVNNLDERLKSV